MGGPPASRFTRGEGGGPVVSCGDLRGLRAPVRQDALVDLRVREFLRGLAREEVGRVGELELAEVVEGLVLRVAEGDEGEEDGGVGLRRLREGLGGGGLRVRGAVGLEDDQGGGVGGVLGVVREDFLDGRVVAGTAHAAEARVEVVDLVLVLGEGELAGAVEFGGEEDDVDLGLGVQVGGEGEGLLTEGLGGAVLVVRPHARGAVEDEVGRGGGAGEAVGGEGGGGGGVGGAEGGGYGVDVPTRIRCRGGRGFGGGGRLRLRCRGDLGGRL